MPCCELMRWLSHMLDRMGGALYLNLAAYGLPGVAKQVRGVVLVNAAGKFEEVKATVEAPLEAALQGAERDAAQPALRQVCCLDL